MVSIRRMLTMYQYLAERYTNWKKTVKAVKERTGTKLAGAARYDELMAKNMSASGVTAAAKALPSTGYDIAGEYLEVAASIVSPPLPELNTDNAAKDSE